MPRRSWTATTCTLVALLFAGCPSNRQSDRAAEPSPASSVDRAEGAGHDAAPSGGEPGPEAGPAGLLANVVGVKVQGQSGAYQFAVTLRSPDTGCSQYANWWEVVRSDGTLVYRRILGHGHVDEQPFSRSGGPVTINSSDEVIVRAHMHEGGYGGTALRGSPAGGFRADPSITESFAPSLADREPLPTDCAF